MGKYKENPLYSTYTLLTTFKCWGSSEKKAIIHVQTYYFSYLVTQINRAFLFLSGPLPVSWLQVCHSKGCSTWIYHQRTKALSRYMLREIMSNNAIEGMFLSLWLSQYSNTGKSLSFQQRRSPDSNVFSLHSVWQIFTFFEGSAFYINSETEMYRRNSGLCAVSWWYQ